jgi:MFS family permease
MKKIFYGWKIVGAGSALQFLQCMLLTQAFGVYVAVLVEERGWSKTALSAAAALKATEVALLGPVLGWMVDRYGTERIVRVGVALFGIGFILVSQVETLLQFYAAFIILALGAAMFSNFLVSVAIIQWFERQRTRALSALQFGGAIGGLFVFAVALSIQHYGWRVTAFGSGVIALLIGLPLAGIMKTRPEDLGETIDGVPPQAKRPGGAPTPLHRMFTAPEALRTSAFWLISIGHGFALLAVLAINVHAISHIKSGLGYSLSQATLFFGLVTLGQGSGVALGWILGERFVKRKVAACCMLMHATGLLMLTYAPNAIVLVAGLLIHGLGWGLRGPFMQAIRADYFGRQSIGTIMGLSSMITVIGHIAGPLIAGAFADAFGNYRAGFTFLALVSLLGAVCFLVLRRPH